MAMMASCIEASADSAKMAELKSQMRCKCLDLMTSLHAMAMMTLTRTHQYIHIIEIEREREREIREGVKNIISTMF